MEHDIKEALRLWHDDGHVYGSVHHAGCDARKLADAFAAEHPVDDDEPVTSQWIESVGGKRGLRTEYVIVTGTVFVVVDSMAGDMKIGFRTPHSSGQMMVVAVTVISSGCTRGNVRRLCSAVGYELKESE